MVRTKVHGLCLLSILSLTGVGLCAIPVPQASSTAMTSATPSTSPTSPSEEPRATDTASNLPSTSGHIDQPGRDPQSGPPSETNPDVEIVASLDNIGTTTETQLGGPITVAIKGLKRWSRSKSHDPRKLRLYLAGHMLPNVEPTLVNVDQEYANFFLTPHTSNTDERQNWFGILEEARRHQKGSIPISVGLLSDLQPFDSRQFINLRVYPAYTPAVVGMLLMLLIALIYLGSRSQLLRDGSAPPAPAMAPYSLGRVQMAWWFYLVIAAYLYLWMITGQVNMLTPSVLALIGISAGTGLSAIFVDQQKSDSSSRDRMTLVSRQAALNSRIIEIEKTSPVAGSSLDVELQKKKDEVAQVNASLASLPGDAAAPVSQGFIDIFRDGDGISFSRFQIVVWSVVMGGVFVRAVLSELTMPEFDSTLLGLMGLSSGTYVGFKFPETPK